MNAFKRFAMTLIIAVVLGSMLFDVLFLTGVISIQPVLVPNEVTAPKTTDSGVRANTGAPNLKIISAEQVTAPRDGMVSVAVTVQNDGDKAIPAGLQVDVQQALSSDMSFDGISQSGSPDFALGMMSFHEGLQPGAKRTIIVSGTLRDNYPNTGYIVVMADYLHVVAESNEADNVMAIEYHPPDKTTVMNAAAK